MAGVEVRCPACNKLIHVVSSGFRGTLEVHCSRCKLTSWYPAAARVEDPPRLNCPDCGKWISSGVVEEGVVRSMCPRCKALITHQPGGTSGAAPRPAKPRPVGGVPRVQVSPAERDAAFVTMVEQRWHAMRAETARTRAVLAVGLRFAVFNRDGFRCRYCGRSVDDGAVLEADHVVPRSKGGSDTMANLVTACWECNSGKSDRELTPGATVVGQRNTPVTGGPSVS